MGGLASVFCKVMHEGEGFGRAPLGCLKNKLGLRALGLEVAHIGMPSHFWGEARKIFDGVP